MKLNLPCIVGFSENIVEFTPLINKHKLFLEFQIPANWFTVCKLFIRKQRDNSCYLPFKDVYRQFSIVNRNRAFIKIYFLRRLF